MKKILKFITVTLTILLSLLNISTIVFGWTPPKIKEYEEATEELRAVWVCTVGNMDIEKQMSSSSSAIEEWKQNYLTILENSKNNGMNTIIFQVRPCNDAFYPSKYNPWSQYLVGFGIDPGWDPLAWMIEVTHNEGMEYHAWLNPYRASTTDVGFNYIKSDNVTGFSYIADYDENELKTKKTSFFNNLKTIASKYNNVVDNPIFYDGEELNHAVVLGTEGNYVLNPAASSTINNLNNTIEELITNYELDGIHFDDYFYPATTSYSGTNDTYKGYTFSTEPNIDMSDYLEYKKAGGELDIYNFRRENVNNLIHSLSDIIRKRNETSKTKCAFGISPCSSWAPAIENCPVGSPRGAEGGEPEPCNNYYSYSDLYADTRKWVLENWLDYIVPQNYTYLGSSESGYPNGNYNRIVRWWSSTVASTKVKLYMGTPTYQIDEWAKSGKATKSEISYQIRWNYSKKYNVSGYVCFRYESTIKGIGKQATDYVRENTWKMAALTPIYDSYSYEKATSFAEGVKLDQNTNGTYTLTFNQVDNAKAYAICEDDKVISRVLKGDNQITFEAVPNKSYKLITYGYDNKPYSSAYVVDLTKAYKNQKPAIKLEEELKKNYLVKSKIDVNFIITDAENDPLTYSLKIIKGSDTYELVKEGTKVTNNMVKYTFDAYAVPMENLKFIITVKDDQNETIFETESFNLVKELPIENPTQDDNKETKDDNKKEESKKCNKKKTGTYISLLAGLTLFIIKFKRRDD